MPATQTQKPVSWSGDHDRFLATILDTVGSLVLVLDREGRIVLFNRECERVSGYTFAELEGRHVWDVLLLPEDVARVKEVFGRLRAGESNAYDNVWVTKDGRRREIAWQNTILGDERGDVQFVVPTGVDVTERRVAERKLRETEARLAEAAKLEAIGRLAGGVAHDFNNLLVVILSQADAVLDALPPADPLRDDVEEIGQAARKAAALTQQLLAFGRRRAVRHVQLDLNAAVEDVSKILVRLVGEDVRISTRLAPDLGGVLADFGGVQQVLLNLVVNARDAMPSGGTVTIETENLDLEPASADEGLPAGRFVALCVTDTGAGMSAEVRKHLFEPFFTTKGEGCGTGLGLATVFGIVKQASGHVLVESEPGAGARFRILLPRHDARPEGPPASAPASTHRSGAGRSVLVVEDDPAVLRVAARALEADGYRVLATADPERALREVAEGRTRFDLVVTDVAMPRLGGKELAAEIHRATPRIPIVFMTGHADERLLREGLLAEGVILVRKPFEPAALLQAVSRALASDPGAARRAS
ncbi:MAG TPA: response regulator [Anaeromyxobacter sp.]